MNFIRAAREALDISQAELAGRLGVSKGTVAAWELLPDGGGHGFKLARIGDVARVLRCSKAELMRWWLDMQRVPRTQRNADPGRRKRKS